MIMSAVRLTWFPRYKRHAISANLGRIDCVLHNFHPSFKGRLKQNIYSNIGISLNLSLKLQKYMSIPHGFHTILAIRTSLRLRRVWIFVFFFGDFPEPENVYDAVYTFSNSILTILKLHAFDTVHVLLFVFNQRRK